MPTICDIFLMVHEEEWTKCPNSFILAQHFLEVSEHISNLNTENI